MALKGFLLDTLKKEKYHLLTDEHGKELLDKDGNLIVRNPESGDWIYIPNTEAVRELYELNEESTAPSLGSGTADSGLKYSNKNPSHSRDETNTLEVESKSFQDTEKTKEETDSNVELSDELLSERNSKRTKEISSETTCALLRLMASDKYEKLFSEKEIGRKGQWKKVFQELICQGYALPGQNTSDKVRKLCQKWRNIKKLALKHHQNKTRRKNTPRPPHYSLIMHIITKEMKLKGQRCKTGAGMDMTGNLLDLEASQPLDHDYAGFSEEKSVQTQPVVSCESQSSEQMSSKPLLTAHDQSSVLSEYLDFNNEHFILPENLTNESSLKFNHLTTDNMNNCESSSNKSRTVNNLSHHPTESTSLNRDNSTVDGDDENMRDACESDGSSEDGDGEESDSETANSSTAILRQIRDLQEAAMVKQQENFSKVITLLEEQVKHQRTLNDMFFQFVTKRSNKSKSHFIVNERIKK